VEAAVEAEVARRLAEQEKQRLEGKAHETIESSKTDTMPSGVLMPLLKRHKDLDSELMARLQELERK
jgi:kinesin family protein 22